MRSSIAPLLLLLLVGSWATGCATTTEQSAGRYRYSGFLKNYSDLGPSETEGGALAIYISPDADFAKYDKVMIDPVTIWRTIGSNMANVPQAELESLANYLWISIADELEKDYELVERPGRSTLRIRAALTEAREANEVMDTISTVGPITRGISQMKKMMTGTQAFVGTAGIELEFLDSLTRTRIAAAVDERSGGKTLDKREGKWADVDAAFDYWAGRIRRALAQLSGREVPAATE